jgi:hypothetical protein
MLLRIDETAVIAVLDDSQGVLSIYFDELSKICGPLSPLQERELAAHFASMNIHLADRTVFSSEFDVLSEECTIVGRRPSQLALSDWNSEIRGEIMHRICEEMLIIFPNKNEILEEIKTGQRTFLVDANGEFVRDSMELDESRLQ